MTWTQFKVLLVEVLMLGIMLLVYGGMVSESFRKNQEGAAQFVYNQPIPGLLKLKSHPELKKLDLAYLYSWVLMLASFWGWREFVFRAFHARQPATKYTRFILALAVIVIVCDMSLFLMNAAKIGFGSKGEITWRAVIMTVCYGAVIVLLSTFSAQFKEESRVEVHPEPVRDPQPSVSAPAPLANGVRV